MDKEYKKLARRFALYTRNSGNFRYIYDLLSKLCKALSYKYNIGIRVREVYQVRDEQGLRAVVAGMKKAGKAIKAFYESFRVLWHKENKPNGFEIHDMRLGELMQRMKHCRERLENYLAGEEEFLPALENELLDFWGSGKEYSKETPCYPLWSGIITPNQLN